MDKAVNAEYFNARMGVIWVQPGGPNSECFPLACHDLGDIAEPQGDITTKYCPDPANVEEWVPVLQSQGPPGRPTTSITTHVGKTSDWLERQKRCVMPVYINQRHCGRADTFLNYDRYFSMKHNLFTDKGLTNLVSREGTDASEQSFGLSAVPEVVRIFPLKLNRQDTAETDALNDIAFCNDPRCAGPCGPAQDVCQLGYAVADGAALLTANVERTADGGVSGWAATATDPFGAAEIIASDVCFDLDQDTRRLVVGRGTADVGNPAEIAYSDDEGATWTLVNVGAANGEFFFWNGALFALDRRHVWAGLNSGDLFFSSDGAQTWTEVVTANAGVEEITYIHFADEMHGLFVGDQNIVYYTEDGGVHWAGLVGPNPATRLNCCSVIDPYRYWIGDAGGQLWFTADGGTTWTERVGFTGAGTLTGINDVMFIDEYHGAFVATWTAAGPLYKGSIYRTWNGGHDWERLTPVDDTFDSGGFNAVWMCHPNLIFAVGEIGVGDVTAMIYCATGGQGAY